MDMKKTSVKDKLMNRFWFAVYRGILLSLAAAIVWFSYSIISII